jgi:hypothetical protein
MLIFFFCRSMSSVTTPTTIPESQENMLINAVIGTLALWILLALKCMYSSLKKSYIKHFKSRKYRQLANLSSRPLRNLIVICKYFYLLISQTSLYFRFIKLPFIMLNFFLQDHVIS